MVSISINIYSASLPTVSVEILICISLMATDVECFFQLLIIILVYSFFCELSVWIFCSFSVELSCYCWVGGEDPLEKGMATHSTILAWRILCTEEPGGLQSMGSQRVGRKDCVTNTFTFLYSDHKSFVRHKFYECFLPVFDLPIHFHNGVSFIVFFQQFI